MTKRRWSLWLWVPEIAVVVVLTLLPARLARGKTVGGGPEHAAANVALQAGAVFGGRHSCDGCCPGVYQLWIPGQSLRAGDIAAIATGAGLGPMDGLWIRGREQKWLA